jgi:hypothetical protein
MTIKYNYKIISVDEAARCMEVVYSADGYETMHISARLPYDGESLESVLTMYSPVNLWLEKERTVVTPQVGKVGEVDLTPVPEPEPTYADLRAAEYPPHTDYLDGVVKNDQAQIDAYIAACQAVKAKYPKV